jgi:ParB family transcriptional regulator, chromosome partitioning protein
LACVTGSRRTRSGAEGREPRQQASGLVSGGAEVPAGATTAEVLEESRLLRLAVDQIDVPRVRIRKDLGSVGDLAYSLGSVGLLHPIQVYPARGRYRLIAGERRLKAARRLGWTHIQALVREPRGDDLLLELIENTQRKWLTDVEEADALIRLVRDEGYDVREVAAQVGRSEAFVSKRIRVFEEPSLRAAVEQRGLAVSIAEELLSVDASERPRLLEQTLDEAWDGRRVRDAIRALAQPAPEALPAEAPAATRGGAAFGEPDEPVLEGSFTEVETPDDPGVGGHASPAPAPAGESARPSDLTRQIRALEHVLRHLRPFQLTTHDEEALAKLLEALLKLARAHAQAGGQKGPVIPTMEEAERLKRRR